MGSTRVPRVGFGVPPNRTFQAPPIRSRSPLPEAKPRKVRAGGTPAPTCGTHVLPGASGPRLLWKSAGPSSPLAPFKAPPARAASQRAAFPFLAPPRLTLPATLPFPRAEARLPRPEPSYPPAPLKPPLAEAALPPAPLALPRAEVGLPRGEAALPHPSNRVNTPPNPIP